MSKEENISIQMQFIDAVNGNELDRLNGLVSPNVIDNDPVEGQVPGPQGYIRFFRSLRRAFPDMNIDIEQIVADDEDSVGFAYTFTGTHYGEYYDVEGTGSKVQIRGMQMTAAAVGVILLFTLPLLSKYRTPVPLSKESVAMKTDAPLVLQLAVSAFFLLAVTRLIAMSYSPFLYFQF